jgi:hypothetical protein
MIHASQYRAPRTPRALGSMKQGTGNPARDQNPTTCAPRFCATQQLLLPRSSVRALIHGWHEDGRSEWHSVTLHRETLPMDGTGMAALTRTVKPYTVKPYPWMARGWPQQPRWRPSLRWAPRLASHLPSAATQHAASHCERSRKARRKQPVRDNTGRDIGRWHLSACAFRSPQAKRSATAIVDAATPGHSKTSRGEPKGACMEAARVPTNS